MNLKIKLEHAAFAWLLAGATGSDYDGTDFYCSYGGKPTDDDGTVPPEQPPFPFVTIMAVTSPDDVLPGVAQFELRVMYHSDAQDSIGSRRSRMAALEAMKARMLQPPDDDATWSDSNPEGGALLTFANKPVGTDSRDSWRVPLHIYRIEQQSDPSRMAERIFEDELVFIGTAQTMNSSD